jgi:WD40 repeat protein
VHAGHNKTGEVAITTLDFPDNETTTFWVGTEEGNVYQANRYDRAGAKAGLNQYDVYKGHSGPVMGLHFHPLVGPVDFSDLFLTSSVDWTVKLWRAKSLAKPSTTQHTVSPIYSFDEADDYVYDVKWHPAHPASFGTVDGSGKFDLWNLNADTEVCATLPKIIWPLSDSWIHRYPWYRLTWARAVRSTSFNGIVKTEDVLLWEAATGSYTYMTSVTWLSRESQSGRICRKRSLVSWEVGRRTEL